jgi:CheY-like chemotaxis protein
VQEASPPAEDVTGTVVVVEDDHLIRAGLEATLEAWGHTVLGAGSVAEAVEVVQGTAAPCCARTPRVPGHHPYPGAAVPPRFVSTADLNAVIEQVAPDVLALLGDGTPRTRSAIIAALVARHPRNDIKRTIARLAVLGQLDEQGGKYVLASAPKPG